METNLELGLSMLLVGMTTVFFILFFVVAGGNILIRFTNRYYTPVQEAIAKSEQSGDKRKMAAIVAAVDVVTGGKGKVASIRKSVS